MNIAFIGGGSLRVLPIVRVMLEKKLTGADGSIRLIDLSLERAEAVGRMILRCPEYRKSGCRVLWTKDAEEGLEGVDYLYITMAMERYPDKWLAKELGRKYGVWTSDMLSLNGAFLAMRGGAAILNFARIMERKAAPGAKMLIFSNPVPVFSNLVNNFTKIRALGICQGFENHFLDLPRLSGKDEHAKDLRVIASGVNHFAFIQSGTWDGRDLFEVMDELIPPDRPSVLERSGSGFLRNFYLPEELFACLRIVEDIYRRNRALLFSSEADGLYNLAPGFSLEKFMMEKRWIKSLEEESSAAKEESLRNYKALFDAVKSEDDSVWTSGNPVFGRDEGDLSIRIVEAGLTGRTFRMSASAPNRGAVAGFGEKTALEYTMDIRGSEILPVPGQKVPRVYSPLIAGYAAHQTLLSEALGTGDPSLFRDALDCYPATALRADRNAYLSELFEIYPDIPEKFRLVRKYYSASAPRPA